MWKKVQEVMDRYWGFQGFLPFQREAMECILEERDSLVVLPTGGGKSLCFQAPAVAMDGITIVVSPLIALMKDQVDALVEHGIPAAKLDSSLSFKEQSDVFRRVLDGTLKLLYLAPERLVTQRALDFLARVRVSFVAVDEAHCVSMWGHEFRPEYRALGVLKESFPHTPVHAYTATATELVRTDIAEQLRLNNPSILVGSFLRPNLSLTVERRHNRVKQVCAVLDRHRGESGIVYSIRRRDVDTLARELAERGYRVAPYHAGMSDDERAGNQDAFLKDRVDTIIATVAFGMGIDKSNVRYVIHTGMPKSLEHYQQEIGRAGRDGLAAECRLLWSGGDYGVWRSIIEDLEEPARAIALEKLNSMFNFCAGIRCRHETLLGYFGQKLDAAGCGACDVCRGEVESMPDALVVGQKILSCVLRLRERFGADYTANVLTGSRERRILTAGHDRLSTYGLLSDSPKRHVRDWLEQLVSQGCLAKTGDYQVLTVTEMGRRVLKGETSPILLTPSAGKATRERPDPGEPEEPDEALFQALKRTRKEIADAKRIPAYIVFHDSTLKELARRRPRTRDEMLHVPGMGEKKCEQYGDAFLAVIQDFSG